MPTPGAGTGDPSTRREKEETFSLAAAVRTVTADQQTVNKRRGGTKGTDIDQASSPVVINKERAGFVFVFIRAMHQRQPGPGPPTASPSPSSVNDKYGDGARARLGGGGRRDINLPLLPCCCFVHVQ